LESNLLRSYQFEGVDFLSSNSSALLADEMGLGKTVQTAIAIERALEIPEVNRILVVAPSSLRLNWEEEIHRWAPSVGVRRVIGTEADRLATYMLPVPVLIASYEQIRLDSIKMRTDQIFDIVILDEAQRIKNPGSSLSLACKLLSRRWSWALTGTPVENSVEDLLAIFSFLRPGLLRVHMPRSQMHRSIQPFFLRRRKKDVLGDMPPIQIQDVPLELEGEQLEEYERVWNDRMTLLEDYESRGTASEVGLLAILTRLKQLCNYEPNSGMSAKMDVLEGFVEELMANGNKCLIFSQYVETLNFIANRLPGRHSLFHGGLSESERAAVVSAFEQGSEPSCLLISLKAGGVGLNLNSASCVIMFDRWWNPAVENQAIARAHRFGKTESLQVIRFVVKNTVEERISAILQEKSDLFKEYVESAENWQSSSLRGSQIRRILQVAQNPN
jgi:SNF2 family DNA or RNA helicase